MDRFSILNGIYLFGWWLPLYYILKLNWLKNLNALYQFSHIISEIY